MTSYLICWKPSTENSEQGWPEAHLATLAETLSKSGRAVEPWRFNKQKGLTVGERVFLVRQGKRGHAILGYGAVDGEPRGTDGRVPVSFEALVDPRSNLVFATSAELQEIKAGRQPWGTQSSGVVLAPEIADALQEKVVGRSPVPESKSSNPDWTRDELILALDLYFRVPAARGSKIHPECIRLSELLNALPIHHGQSHGSTFRNANGVGMKLSNFLKYDPTYKGKGLTAGSHLEKEVWDTFSGNLAYLRNTAAAVIAGAKELLSAADDEAYETAEEDFEAEEGRILTAIHKRRERQIALIKKKKDGVKKQTGKLQCEVCSFDFSVQYGGFGEGFAECHHGRPVSSMEPGEKTKLSDLHILCANCHRIIHRQRPWLSIEQLRRIVDAMR
ncbi:HNH endonuclease [Caballeronia glathei]|uniref:HNH endonuclease n=1 Tax=Caballeronia glathei TaxID=60547 RepID=UPI000504CF49|nr:HNH endonuclease [Caballeronia glathei]CDY78050.1 HNH endonuclease [Caballeronia glathei]